MAIPGNALSSALVEAPFVGAKNRSDINQYNDWEDGGIAVGDTSQGFFYQAWRCRIVENLGVYSLVINPEFGADITIYTGSGVITECSLAFDQTMKPYIAFVEDGQPKLRWYDPLIPDYDIMILDPTIASPRLTLDDKRTNQIPNSDVILAYVRNGNLCIRQQRDRFNTEYILTTGLVNTLIKIGMNTKLRMQFLIGNM